jgi:hypothetical protein
MPIAERLENNKENVSKGRRCLFINIYISISGRIIAIM